MMIVQMKILLSFFRSNLILLYLDQETELMFLLVNEYIP